MKTETPPKPKLNATQRTLKRLRDRGYTVAVCEKRISIGVGEVRKDFTGSYLKDLFDFQDVQAYKPGVAGVWAIQSTSRQYMSDHLKKYRRNPEVAQKIRDWLACGNRFSIVGWDYVMVPKLKGGGLKGVWRIHENPVDADMLEPNAADLVAIAVAQKEADEEADRKTAKRKAKRTAAQKVRDETEELFA